MILNTIEQEIFPNSKYSPIPYIDESEAESESTEQEAVDDLDDFQSVDEAEIEEFDRFFLLSSPEDDATSIQEQEDIRCLFENSGEKKILKRTVSLDSVPRKCDSRKLSEKRKRSMSDLILKSDFSLESLTAKHNDKQRSSECASAVIAEGTIAEKIALLNAKARGNPLKSVEVDAQDELQLAGANDTKQSQEEYNKHSCTALDVELLRFENLTRNSDSNAQISGNQPRNSNMNNEGCIKTREVSTPLFNIQSDENVLASFAPISFKASDPSHVRQVEKSVQTCEQSPSSEIVKQHASSVPFSSTNDDSASDAPSSASDCTHPCLASGKSLGVTARDDMSCEPTPIACSALSVLSTGRDVSIAETGEGSESACETLSTVQDILEAGIFTDINEAFEESGVVLRCKMHTGCEVMPKSALKHTGSVSKQARVIFNESKNVYFDANYVIYVDYDEEEFEIDLISDSELERPQLVSVKQFELPPSLGDPQPVTLSPPDGYKDGLGLETDASMREHPVTTVPETSESDSSDRSDVESPELEVPCEAVLGAHDFSDVTTLAVPPSSVAMEVEHKQDLDSSVVSLELEMEPPRSILKGGKNWRESVKEKTSPAVRFDNCDEKCDDTADDKVDGKQNSAFQQLFPRAAKRLIQDQSEHSSTPVGLVSQDADLFKRYEDWRHFMNSRPAQEKEMDDLLPASNPVLRRSIEKNALRRSLVRKSSEQRDSVDPVNDLTEKLRWLTDIDESEDTENAYVKMSDVVPEIKLEMEQQLLHQQHLQQLQSQHEQHHCCHQIPTEKEPEKPIEEKKKNEKIYKKFNDFFRSKKEKDDKNQKAKVRRSVSPPPPSEVEPGFTRKKKEQMPDILPRTAIQPQPAKRSDLLTLRVPDDGNSGDSGSSGAESYSLDDIEEVLGGTGCTVHHARYVPGEESRDDSGGSRSSRSSGDSGVGVQDSSIDTADGQPKAGEEELALFVQRDANRLDRLKKRYSITEEDETEDYGFLRRPSVRGIKPKFGTTTEIIKQMQAQLQPPSIATRGTSHMTWPYPAEQSQSEKRKGVVSMAPMQSVIEERQALRPQDPQFRFIRPTQPPRLQRLASSPNLLARPDTCPIETISSIRRVSVIPPHHHPRPEMVVHRYPVYPPQPGQPRPMTLAPPHSHSNYGLRSPLQQIPEHYNTLPHPLTSSYHGQTQRLPPPQYRGVDDSVIYTTDGRYRPYQHQIAYYRPEVSDCPPVVSEEQKVSPAAPKGEREGPEGASSSPGLAADVVPSVLEYTRKDAAALIPASLALVRP